MAMELQSVFQFGNGQSQTPKPLCYGPTPANGSSISLDMSVVGMNSTYFGTK
jgi:hypothetical protein